MIYDLAYVAGWDQYNLHDIVHVSWIESVIRLSCTASHSGTRGTRLSTVDR